LNIQSRAPARVRGPKISWRNTAPNSNVRFFHPPFKMADAIKNAFQRVWGRTTSAGQPILCKFCGKPVKDAHYAPDGSVRNGPKSKMDHNPDNGVTVIWHKTCHRPSKAGRHFRLSQANTDSGMELEGGTVLISIFDREICEIDSIITIIRLELHNTITTLKSLLSISDSIDYRDREFAHKWSQVVIHNVTF